MWIRMQWWWCGLFIFVRDSKRISVGRYFVVFRPMGTVYERRKNTKSFEFNGGRKKRSRIKLNFSSLGAIGWISSYTYPYTTPMTTLPVQFFEWTWSQMHEKGPYVISETRNTALAVWGITKTQKKTFSVLRLNCFRWSKTIGEVENDFFLHVPKCSENDWWMHLDACTNRNSWNGWRFVKARLT